MKFHTTNQIYIIQSQVAPLLLYLRNNGVTNEDIINMSQLVVSFQNSNFLTNISSQGGNKPNGIGITIIPKKTPKMKLGNYLSIN